MNIGAVVSVIAGIAVIGAGAWHGARVGFDLHTILALMVGVLLAFPDRLKVAARYARDIWPKR